jgi:hypothetical protein
MKLQNKRDCESRQIRYVGCDIPLNDKRDELIFDLFERRFDAEIDRAKNLDSNGGNMVGFVSIVVGLTLRAD